MTPLAAVWKKVADLSSIDPQFGPVLLFGAGGQLVEVFKKSGKHIAMVTDEFGSIVGLLTMNDVMEAIVGDLPEPGDRKAPQAVRRLEESVGERLFDAIADLLP